MRHWSQRAGQMRALIAGTDQLHLQIRAQRWEAAALLGAESQPAQPAQPRQVWPEHGTIGKPECRGAVEGERLRRQPQIPRQPQLRRLKLRWR